MKFFAAIATLAASLATLGAGTLAEPLAKTQTPPGTGMAIEITFTNVALTNCHTWDDKLYGHFNCGNTFVRRKGLRWGDVTVRSHETVTVWACSNCTGLQHVVFKADAKCHDFGFDVRSMTISCEKNQCCSWMVTFYPM
jgi:hypothetical protein